MHSPAMDASRRVSLDRVGPAPRTPSSSAMPSRPAASRPAPDHSSLTQGLSHRSRDIRDRTAPPLAEHPATAHGAAIERNGALLMTPCSSWGPGLARIAHLRYMRASRGSASAGRSAQAPTGRRHHPGTRGSAGAPARPMLSDGRARRAPGVRYRRLSPAPGLREPAGPDGRLPHRVRDRRGLVRGDLLLPEEVAERGVIERRPRSTSPGPPAGPGTRP
jgi:hypothetical protein